MWLLHGGVKMCGHVLRVKCVIVVSGVAESARASGVFNEVAMSVAAMHAFGKSATAINAFGKSVAAIHPFITSVADIHAFGKSVAAIQAYICAPSSEAGLVGGALSCPRCATPTCSC